MDADDTAAGVLLQGRYCVTSRSGVIAKSWVLGGTETGRMGTPTSASWITQMNGLSVYKLVR